ncbi:ABC transporter [Geothermobacter hydrogeniphilus]|uniref:ABC transporter n=1 Tax=Geothermobacter hydrogeniphilus TaxID=1969733 RepID=A0A2K2HBD7_9BACT|nr:ATP-binding cassette domain-containing protein [Geothermobacter hydrogeniphilus]PNU20624.1 ABC transporter [Geothermobacter hydrogeniphilus]
MEPFLRVESLLHRYPGMSGPAVDGLSFGIAPGEIYGLLGPNGAGKSTTISILCTLLQATAGTVRIGGLDPLRQATQVRRLIGLVPQEIALYPQLSARENLLYFGRLHGLHGRRLLQRAESCLALVGLLEAADRRVADYSGGMARRANLAAGIVHEPQLLFLDEPTVGIDAQSRRMILENLLQLNREGMTMLYTTHYMEEAQLLCNRVAIMDRGRVVVEGAPTGLLEQHADCGTLEELFLQLTGRQLRD